MMALPPPPIHPQEPVGGIDDAAMPRDITPTTPAAAKEVASEAALPSELYASLRAVAAALLRRERPDHTLQPTALVHEAFLRLRSSATLPESMSSDESAFRGLAATTMRRILVDHARRHRADKRGGGRVRVELPEASIDGPQPLELLALDEALEELAKHDPRKARVVELRFFGGLTGEEAGRLLGVSRTTIESDWFMARAWLRRRLGESTAAADQP